jgi:hypothetical protein
MHTNKSHAKAVRKDNEPQMNQPSSRRRGTMAGKLQIYADGAGAKESEA